MLDWRYLNDTAQLPSSGLSTSTLHFLVPTTPGTYEFRFFAEGGGLLSTSGNLVVPQTVAQISVNGIAPPTSVSAAPGDTLTVQIAGGPANPTDWVALAPLGAPNSNFVSWRYLDGSSIPPSAGVSSATLSFVLPSEAGTYELRLFANNSYQRITTSSAITASTGPPQVTVTMTSPFAGTTFNAPASLLVTASASITGGTISRVDFYTGSALLGSAAAPPYAVNWENPPQAVHVLTAAVVDATNTMTTSAPIAITVATSGTTTGTLGAPIAAPLGGVYGPGQSVTLTAAPGSTIRYTTDGSDPDEASPIFAEPLIVTSFMTLRARAYQPNWTESNIAAEIYVVDTAPPTIAPTLDPPANANGWHRGKVTISFKCHDASLLLSCPSDVIVADDGGGQVVTVTASDVHGNTGTVSVTLNIDRTPPIVSIATPSNNLVTADAAVAVTGEVSDALAGVELVKCNGDIGTLDAESVGCSVALRPGMNAVVISVMDLAGNSASAGVRVRQTGLAQRLSIAPGEPTMRMGQSLVLQAVTEFGPVTTGVTWSLSAPGIVSLSNDGETSVLGDAPGVVTVTVALGDLVAETEITVVAGTLAFGTPLWKDTSAIVGGTRVLYAQSGMSGGADLFAVSSNSLGTGADIRALDLSGRVLWTESTAGDPLFSDVYGGVIALIDHDEYPGLYGGITRLAGAGGFPWTYEANGRLMSRPVQTADGLIVFTEQPEDEDSDSLYLVGIEGQAGRMRFRLRAPHGSITNEYTGNCVGWGETGTVDFSPMIGPMAIGEDGAVYFQLLTQDVDTTLIDCSMYPTSPAVATWGIKQELSVARLAPAGTLTLDSIWNNELAPTAQQEITLDQVFPSSVAPNGLGSVVASYEVHQTRIIWGEEGAFEGVSAFLWSNGITYPVAPRHAFANPPVDIQASPLEFVGDDGTVYLRSEAGVTAMNAITGETMWTTSNTTMVVPQLDGAALFQTPSGDLISISKTGASIEVGHLPVVNPVQLALGIYAGAINGTVVSMFGPPVDEASFAFEPTHSFVDPWQGPEGRQSSGTALVRRFNREDFAAIALLNFFWPGTQASGVEYAGTVCREANGLWFYWDRPALGTTGTAPGPVMEPEQCADGATTVAYGHTHPDQNFWADQYPSGYQSPAAYHDVDLDPNNGQQPSDLKNANDRWASHPQDRYRNLMGYLAGRDLNDLVVFSRYKRDSLQLWAEDNIYRYDAVADTWVKVPNAPW